MRRRLNACGRTSRGIRHGIGAALLMLVVIAAGCGVPAYEVTTSSVPLALGSDTVEVLIHTSEAAGWTYVNVHDDENTAASAAQSVIESHGGRLIELQHTGEREVRFTIDRTTYAFDPNRIFTPAGLDSTLRRIPSSAPASRTGAGAASTGGDSTRAGDAPAADSAHAAVEKFADRLLEIIGLDTLDMLVTVHNNSPGAYSARTYTPGERFASDARFAHIAADQNADDFYFVTTEPIYVALRDAGYNVVLQDEDLVTDDGSLSVLCSRRGIPYVNVEAAHGHFEMQVQMLVYLHDMLTTERR